MNNTTQKKSKLFGGKKEFGRLPKKFIYMNNGTEGVMPDCVMDAYLSNLKNWANNPTTSYELDPALGKRQKKNRKSIAGFLGVGLNNICLTESTTMGLNMVLMGLNFKPRDRLVITNHEHPATVSPIWILKQRLGIVVEVRDFPEPGELRNMDPDQLLDFLFPDIPEIRHAKALCISHIYNTIGVRLPLDKIRQRVDALKIKYLIVDGAQSLGMVDCTKRENRVDNCDFYAAPTHKWMNGPPGTGVLYINDKDLRPPEFYPVLSQKMGAYLSQEKAGTWLPMAEALQIRGCNSYPAYVAVSRLLEFVDDVGGQARIERHILYLAKRVRDFVVAKSPGSLLSPSHEELSSGLISFYPFDWNRPDRLFSDKITVVKVVDALLENRVQVRFVPFPTVDLRNECECRLRPYNPNLLIDCSGEPMDQVYCIRVSTGLFNTEQDVETLFKALRTVLTG